MFAQLRNQFLNFWGRLGSVQKLVLIGLIIAGLAMTGLFMAWAGTPSYVVAFSGLGEAEAGRIVDALNEEGITYQLQGVGTILVPNDMVHEVRLKMASQGLTQGGTVGFELFSGSTLGMTEFSQRVNYRRALEGELERTIGSLNSIEAVRVHIVTPERTLLAGSQPATTASVTIKVNPSLSVDMGQIRAITNLVASSVEGMSADNVVVVDVDGNLLASGMGEGDSGALAAQSDNRRAAEAAFATEVEYKVGQLLNSVLGPNRSVVEANVTLDWTEREVTTQAYDPEQSVVRSSQILTESYNAEGDLEGGIPGAESNLPDPDLEADLTGVEGALYSRSEEITNYEVTQIQSFEIHAPGSVERMTLSVLVDGVEDPAQLQTLQAAITAAAGIDAERGDVLAVETLTFDRSFYENQAAEMAEQGQMDLYIKIGTAVASALMIGALLWYVQRLLANLRLASADAWQPLMMTAGQAGALRAGSTKGELMAGAGGGASAQVAPLDLDHLVDEQLISAPPPPPKAPVIREDDLRTEQAVTDIARDNPAGIADIIHLWLSEDEHA